MRRQAGLSGQLGGTAEHSSPPQAKAYATKPCKKPAYEAAAGCEPAPLRGKKIACAMLYLPI